MTLGEKLQNARKVKGYSQEDLAYKLNVSRQAVQKWESGRALPETSKLSQISSLLDISLDYLLKEEEQASSDISNESIDTSSNISLDKDLLLEEKRYTRIKGWLLLGTVLGPMIFGGAFVGVSIAMVIIAVCYYFINIPLCYFCLKNIKGCKDYNILKKWGIISIFLISLIGGILILITNRKENN